MKNVMKKYLDFAVMVNSDISVIQGSYDWGCYPEDYIIEIPQLVTEQGLQNFLNSIKKQLPKNKKNLINIIPDFMWSFLHEIGHIQHQHTVENSILRNIADYLGHKGFDTLSSLIYFNLKEEKQATQWAVDFTLHNYKLVKKYSKKIGNSYQKYYQKMGLVE